MIDEEKILDKLKSWADPLNEILEYDGIPMWVFYRQMFLTNNFPNRFFKYSVKSLGESFEKNKIKNKKTISFITRKVILNNELIKIKLRKSIKKIKDNSPKVLFQAQSTAIDNGKIYKIGNVVEKIKEQKKIKSYILAYEPIEKNNPKRIKQLENTIYEYIDKQLLKKIKKESKELHKKWKNIPEERKKDLLKLNNKSLYPFIKDELNFLFSREFLFIVIAHHEAHKKIIKEENIKIICAQGAGAIYPKTLFSAARIMNIPRLTIQHGMCFSYIETDLLKDTIFAVFGEKSKQELIEYEIPSKNIIITGPAIYDNIIEYSKIEPKNKTITLMTNGFYIYGLIEKNVYFNYIEKWIKELNKLNFDIIIKLHPEEKGFIKEYKNITKNYKRVTKITDSSTKEELYNIIANSSIVINLGSSVALESMMLNKPVITIMGLHHSAIKDFDIVVQRLLNSNASININKDEDISSAIEYAFKNKKELIKKRKEFLEESCYKIDGNASDRVAKTIYKLIS